MNQLSRFISQPCPRRRGKTIATPKQAQLSWLDFPSGTFSQKHNLCADRKLKQRHERPDFTGSIFKATSRCQEPTSARLFETLRRYELWDPAWSTRGLPPLPDVHFEKAHGAPFSWERLNRSRPQTKT